MNLSFDYSPLNGWKDFTKSAALTESLWKSLDQSNWHYLNFASETSVWESKKDGSVLYVAFDQSSIVQIFAENGQAELGFDSIAAQFGLAKSLGSPPTG